MTLKNLNFKSFLKKNVEKAAVVAKEAVEVEVKKSVDDKIDTVFKLVMSGIAIGTIVNSFLPKNSKSSGIPTNPNGFKTVVTIMSNNETDNVVSEVLKLVQF